MNYIHLDYYIKLCKMFKSIRIYEIIKFYIKLDQTINNNFY